MKSDSVLCLGSQGFHRMHYYEWGKAASPRIVICMHGLTRNGRDFDFLSGMLADDFRVICPDVVGRGRSEWLASKIDYGFVQYLADMTALIARVTGGARKTVHWVGTSMGGLLGILLAAVPNTPIASLVVNDAGTLIPKAALERMARYVGKDPRFSTIEELDAYLRRISAPFGPLTDEQWRHLTVHGARQHGDGSWGMSYDPAIGAPLQGELADIDLSAQWNAIRCPTLLLRGAESDVLLAQTAQAMTTTGPKAKLVEFAGMGHAPMLMVEDQARVVRDFLLSD